MKLHRVLVALCVALMAPGCASIFDGTRQQIWISTAPPDARCKLMRLGAPIGEVASTPGTVTVRRTKHDITIVCSKPGYIDATYMNHSGATDTTLTDVLGGIATLGVSWGVDSATGADNKYEGQVNMTLLPAAPLRPSDNRPFAQPQYSPPPAYVPASPGVAPVAPAAVPAAERDCIRSDGMRMRVSGACPSQTTPVQ